MLLVQVSSPVCEAVTWVGTVSTWITEKEAVPVPAAFVPVTV
jgi:hypothetical protein